MLPFILACAPAPDVAEVTSSFHSPDAPGPWLPGTLEDALTGESGVNLAVQAWFPASEEGSAPYVYGGLLEGAAHEDAVPACDAPRPVLVFSHGSGGIRYQSIFLTEHLASHGWIVVAPDHTYNTLFDDDASRRGELILRRPIDTRDAFDWLAEVAAGPGGPLEGCVDPDAGYAIAGHSFGGYTTLAAAGATLDVAASAAHCSTSDDWLCGDFADVAAAASATQFDLADPRVWAAIAMAPAGHEVLVGGLGDIAVPTLLLGGSLDTATPMATQVTPDYAGLVVTPRMLGELDGAGHFTFSDACAIVATFADCEAPYMQADVAHPIVRTVSTAFLQWVRGAQEAEAWLPPEEPLLAWTEER